MLVGMGRGVHVVDFSCLVERAVGFAGAEVGGLGGLGAEGVPGTGAEDLLFADVVHVDGDAQHGSERNQVGTDVAVADRAVVGSPVVHDRVGIAEGTLAGEAWGKPRGGPGGVRALIEDVVHILGEVDAPALGDLQRGAEAGDEVESAHRHGHAAFGEIACRPAATGEILGDRWVPGGGIEAGLDFLLGDFPEGFHHRLTIAGLLACAIQRGGTRVDEVQDAVLRHAFQFIARHAFHGIGRPIGADIGKNLRGVGEQVTKEHRHAIEAVIFRSDHERRATAIPVERSREDGFKEIAIRAVVGPLALTLEARADGVVALAFFGITFGREAWVTDHQVAGDESHFHGNFPLVIQLRAAAGGFWGVVILALVAVIADPSEGALVFLGVVDFVIDATEELGHIDRFHAHAEVFFKESLVDDRAGDAHRHAAHGEVRLTAHRSDGETGAAEAEDLFLDIGRDRGIARVLDIATVDTKSRKALLGVTGENSGEVNGAGAFRAIKAPDGFGDRRVHVHGFRAIAPAGSDRERDADAFFTELFRAGGRFCDTADASIRDHAFDGRAIAMTENGADQIGSRASHVHGLRFERLANAAEAAIDGGTNPDFWV
ncbi:MAG: hypothetical protein RLZZ224_1235 [Verrucomicrobiota bacterium]